MRSALLVLGAVASLVNAHNDGLEGMPRLFGRSAVADLKARNAFVGQPSAPKEAAPKVEKRQGNTSGRCGQGAGNCAAGYCCSSAGWCGNTSEYCAAPDCQISYGPGCDGNKVPAGESTANVPRPKLGNVAYGGAGIYECLKAGTVALTYDDGPYIYTNDMLDVLAQYNAKATFFITGNNLGKGAIDTNWGTLIKRMHSEGHQIASHTWSHQDLSAITKQQRQNQMIYNEMAFRNILGFFPTYMRPPYSSCTAASGCEADLKTLGYVVSYFDLDTDDYNNVTPQLIQNAKNNFQGNLSTKSPTNGDWLTIAHDIHEQTAHNLTAFMLQTLTNAGYKAVTMGECMNDPPQNWYRTPGVTPTSTASSSTPSSTGGVVSTDGTCGNGVTCQGSAFGNCCSQYGWCGSTTDHCGTGCNSQFGTCSTPSSSAPGSTPTSTDGHCGNGVTCQGSAFGNCCSQYGWCGSTVDHCSTGCQPAFGTCSVSSSVSSASGSSKPASSAPPSSSPTRAPSSSAPVSSRPASSSAPASSTKPSSTLTQAPSSSRPASSSTRPASSSAPASSSTRPASSSTRPASSSSTAPSATSKPVSTNGMCGDKNGKTTCAGSRFGQCCSIWGYCSNDSITCNWFCDDTYGKCK